MGRFKKSVVYVMIIQICILILTVIAIVLASACGFKNCLPVFGSCKFNPCVSSRAEKSQTLIYKCHKSNE